VVAGQGRFDVNLLELDIKVVAGMQLQRNVAAHADVAALVGIVVQYSRAIVIGHGDTVHRGLDFRTAALDEQVIPAVAFIGVLPLPVLAPCAGSIRQSGSTGNISASLRVSS
jgi:hypothetical protein